MNDLEKERLFARSQTCKKIQFEDPHLTVTLKIKGRLAIKATSGTHTVQWQQKAISHNFLYLM